MRQVLITLTEDGRSFACEPLDLLPRNLPYKPINTTPRVDHGRNYSAYEIDGWSIDVTRLPTNRDGSQSWRDRIAALVRGVIV